MKGAVLVWTERCSMFETDDLTTESFPMIMDEKFNSTVSESIYYIGYYDQSVKPEPYSYLFSEVVEWLLLPRRDYRSTFTYNRSFSNQHEYVLHELYICMNCWYSFMRW